MKLKSTLIFFVGVCIYNIVMIHCLGINPNTIVGCLLLTVPMRLIRIKKLSTISIVYCISLSVIIFLVKPQLVSLVPLLAVLLLPQNIYIFHMNATFALPNDIFVIETYSKMRKDLIADPKLQINTKIDPYITGESNKHSMAQVLAILEYEKYVKKYSTLSRSTIDVSGRDFIRNFIREKDPSWYKKAYTDVWKDGNAEGGLCGKVNISDLILKLEQDSGVTILTRKRKRPNLV